MKFIKTYESLDTNEITKIKKYVIWYSDLSDKYEMLQITSKKKEIDEDHIDRHTIYTCKILFYYDRFDKKIVQKYSNDDETFFNTSIKHYVKYTTNNFKECKEMLLILVSANKFNL